MIGHLQVFALTSWFSTNQFIKYSETTRGLRWLIPHHKLPWKKIDTWKKLGWRSNGQSAGERDQQQTDLMSLSYIDPKLSFQTENTTNFGRFHNQHDLSKTSTLYGLPLNSIEYFTYFLVSLASTLKEVHE